MSKRFLSVLLALAMCLGITTMAFAAEGPLEENSSTLLSVPSTTNDFGIVPYGGVETWNKTSATVGTFTMTGNNLTPVKSIGRTGKLYITADYEDAGSGSAKNIKLLIQIVNADTQKTRIEWMTPASSYKRNWESPTGLSVTSGQKIQVFFKAFDETGNYLSNRNVKITYGYIFK